MKKISLIYNFKTYTNLFNLHETLIYMNYNFINYSNLFNLYV